MDFGEIQLLKAFAIGAAMGLALFVGLAMAGMELR